MASGRILIPVSGEEKSWLIVVRKRFTSGIASSDPASRMPIKTIE